MYLFETSVSWFFFAFRDIPAVPLNIENSMDIRVVSRTSNKLDSKSGIDEFIGDIEE